MPYTGEKREQIIPKVSGKDRDNIMKRGHGELLHVHGLKKITKCQTGMEDRKYEKKVTLIRS